jgi:hypothetical protein
MFAEGGSVKILKIVPAVHYRNRQDGRLVSIHGAAPWRNEVEKADWYEVQNGWTTYNDNGTYGLGRAPFADKAFAEQYAVAFNAMDWDKCRALNKLSQIDPPVYVN